MTLLSYSLAEYQNTHYLPLQPSSMNWKKPPHSRSSSDYNQKFERNQYSSLLPGSNSDQPSKSINKSGTHQNIKELPPIINLPNPKSANSSISSILPYVSDPSKRSAMYSNTYPDSSDNYQGTSGQQYRRCEISSLLNPVNTLEIMDSDTGRSRNNSYHSNKSYNSHYSGNSISLSQSMQPDHCFTTQEQRHNTSSSSVGSTNLQYEFGTSNSNNKDKYYSGTNSSITSVSPTSPFALASIKPNGILHTRRPSDSSEALASSPETLYDSLNQSSSAHAEAFMRKYPYIDEHKYPLTYALLHDSKINKAKKKKGGYRCSGPSCKKNCTFTNIMELTKHLDELNTKNEFKCWVEGCAYKYIGFNTSGSLKRHGRIHEGNSNQYRCSYCDKGFGNVFNKQRHEKQIHHV